MIDLSQILQLENIESVMLLQNIVIWLLFGLVVGIIANLLSPYPTAMGIIGNILLGMVGAAVGGLLGNVFFETGVTGFNINSFALALGGALIVIAVARILNRGDRHIKTKVTRLEE